MRGMKSITLLLFFFNIAVLNIYSSIEFKIIQNILRKL